MYQLLYVSTASWTMSGAELNEILDMSRRNNKRLGVTGLLLHVDNGFLQVLEGEKGAVLEIYSRIKRDFRHSGLRVLVERETDERLFEDWSMGFDKLSPGRPHTADIFQITHDAIQNAIAPEKAADIAILLKTFYRANAGLSAA